MAIKAVVWFISRSDQILNHISRNPGVQAMTDMSLGLFHHSNWRNRLIQRINGRFSVATVNAPGYGPVSSHSLYNLDTHEQHILVGG